MDTMDNTGAPVIPAGTETKGGIAYNPLQASQQSVYQRQAQPAPVSPQPPANALDGITFAELQQKKGFQTPDDLAKAYANLESHNKKVEMTAADIIKQVHEPTPQSVAPLPQPVASTQDDQAIKIVQGIVRDQVKPLEERVALQDLFLKNPDAAQFADGIAKAVKENPGISWVGAYKLAKFDALEQNAKESGKQAAYDTIQQKQAVMVGGSTPAQSRGVPDIRATIKDRSIPFKQVDAMVREALASQGL